MRVYFSFLFTFLFLTQLNGQNKEHNKEYIGAKFQVNKNKISIRWAPSTLNLWLCSQNSGYLIQRVELEKEAIADSSSFANTNSIYSNLGGKPFEKNDKRWNEFSKKDSSVKMLYDYRFNLSEIEKKSPEMKFAFNYIQLSADLSIYSAMAQGLFYQDSVYNKKKKYGYKISIIDCNLKYKPVYLTVDPSKDELKLPDIKIRAKSENRLATILWDANSLKTSYSFYTIEKSEDSIRFYPINKQPILFLYDANTERKECVYTDSLPTNHKKYFYRLCGVTIFGEKSNYSNTVAVVGKGFTTQCPIIDSAYLDLKGKSKIVGHFASNKGLDELKQLALVRKGYVKDSPLSIYNTSSVSLRFSVVDNQPALSNYYQVVLINKSTDSLVCPAFFIAGIDSIPPAIPTGITGIVDEKGRVDLKWKKNEEKDFLGYRVFTKNSTNEELKETTHFLLPTPNYVDTIDVNTLTKKIYYSVIAVDQMYNKSNYSVLVELKRPDKIPPAIPAFKEISQIDSTIQLKWVNSYSDDVLYSKLLAMFPDSTNVVELKTWSAKDSVTHFNFTKAISGNRYLFILLCSDSSTNISYAKSHLVDYKVYQIKAIKITNCKANYENNCVELKWEDASKIKQVFNYEVYKNKMGEKPSLYKTTRALALNDYEVALSEHYEYYVKAIFFDGTETVLSSALKLAY